MKSETQDRGGIDENLTDPSVWSPLFHDCLRGVGIVGLYLAATLLSIVVSGPFGGWAVIWLPYGVGLAAFLAYGFRMAPFVALAAILACWLELNWLETSLSPGRTIFGMAGSVLGALGGPGVGAMLIRRHTAWPGDLFSESGATRFYLLGGLASGLVGTALLTLFWIPAGVVPPSMLGFFLSSQFFARLLGTVAVAPVLLLTRSGIKQTAAWNVVSLLAPRLLALGTVLAVLSYVSESAVGNLHAEFQRTAFRKFSNFEQQAAAHLESLK